MRSGAQLHGPHGFKGEEYGKRDVYSARISMHSVGYSRDIPSSPLDILYCNMYFLYSLSCIAYVFLRAHQIYCIPLCIPLCIPHILWGGPENTLYSKVYLICIHNVHQEYTIEYTMKYRIYPIFIFQIWGALRIQYGIQLNIVHPLNTQRIHITIHMEYIVITNVQT